VDPISACGKEVFGETQGTTDWFDRGRVLAAGAGEQDGVALFAALRRPVAALLEKSN
jgi:hypothetical protein